MKKGLLALLMLFSLAASAQMKQVKGSGKMVKQSRHVGLFTSVSYAGSWRIVIAYSKDGGIEVEGDDNLLEYIETKVEGGKLYVSTTKDVRIKPRKPITIYVNMTTIHELNLKGSGDIMGTGAFTSDKTVTAKLSGSGNIKLNFERFSALETTLSGSGNIEMKGTVEKMEAVLSGSGSINCFEVISNHVKGRISGSGSIRVHAKSSIDGTIVGSGSIYYKGTATDVHTRRTGSGKLVKS